MKYSLPGNPANNNSMNIEPEKPIDFYKMVRANSYTMPAFNTIVPNSISESIRKPLADPKGNVTDFINTANTPNTDIQSNTTPILSHEINTPTTLTKPKITLPTNQLSYVPNKPQSIYNNFTNATKITPREMTTNVNSQPLEYSTDATYKTPTYLTDPSVNSINMVAAELNQSIYHSPVGVPLMPLYGYDKCEDSEKDYDYMKQMYPLAAKKMFHEIEEECDKLEYEGSCMFDEYPDKIYLGRIVDRIYDKCKHLMENDSVNAEQFNPEFNRDFDRRFDRDDRRFDRDFDRHDRRFDRDDRRFDRDDRRFDRDDRRFDRHDHNRLRDLTEILFFNEILNRRRRFRSRRRWY